MQSLINAVIEQVLEKLKSDPALCAKLRNAGGYTKVYVLGTRCEKLIKKLTMSFPKGVDIYFCDEAGADSIQPDRYIFPILGCSDMVDIATGKATTPYTAKALQLLLTGCTIEVMLYEYKKYSQSAPTSLYQLYAQYEKNLESYGICKFIAEAKAQYKLHDALVTEKTVVQMHKEGKTTVIVPLNTIVTPLAYEKAKELQLNILKQ